LVSVQDESLMALKGISEVLSEYLVSVQEYKRKNQIRKEKALHISFRKSVRLQEKQEKEC